MNQVFTILTFKNFCARLEKQLRKKSASTCAENTETSTADLTSMHASLATDQKILRSLNNRLQANIYTRQKHSKNTGHTDTRPLAMSPLKAQPTLRAIFSKNKLAKTPVITTKPATPEPENLPLFPLNSTE